MSSILPLQRPTTAELLDLARDALRAEADAVLQVVDRLNETFSEAARILAECRGHVVVAGIGKSGFIGQKLSATLASTGTPSHFLHPTEALHGDLGRIRSQDLLLLISYSGTTEEVLALGAVVRQDGLKVIALTADATSRLAQLSDVAVCIGDVQEACPYNLAPTASTTAMLAVGDALALAASHLRQFTVEDFRRCHPGGTLGRQMLPLHKVLRFRVGHNLPLVRDDLAVSAVLKIAEQVKRRVGAVLLVDGEGRLSGIFTDADLRRLIVKGLCLDLSILDVMTKNPSCLFETDLVRDAVQLIRERRVDEIPVLNESGCPVGLLDVQDLLALKVINDQ